MRLTCFNHLALGALIPSFSPLTILKGKGDFEKVDNEKEVRYFVNVSPQHFFFGS